MGDYIRKMAELVIAEVKRAERIHEPINSLHEGYAVILEELDEFWEEVRKKSKDIDPADVKTELIQCAAMCVRTIVNCVDDKPAFPTASELDKET